MAGRSEHLSIRIRRLAIPQARGPPRDLCFFVHPQFLKQRFIMSALPALSKSFPVCLSPISKCSLLALTPDLQTGWSVHERKGDIKFGTVPFRPSAYEGEGMKFLRFRYWLDEMSKKFSGFDAVIFADVQIHSNTRSAMVAGGFFGQLMAWCEWRQVPYIAASMSDVRKHVLGSDLVNQQSLLDAMRRKGFIDASGHTAEALAVLDWALNYKSRDNA